MPIRAAPFHRRSVRVRRARYRSRGNIHVRARQSRTEASARLSLNGANRGLVLEPTQLTEGTEPVSAEAVEGDAELAEGDERLQAAAVAGRILRSAQRHRVRCCRAVVAGDVRFVTLYCAGMDATAGYSRLLRPFSAISSRHCGCSARHSSANKRFTTGYRTRSISSSSAWRQARVSTRPSSKPARNSKYPIPR